MFDLPSISSLGIALAVAGILFLVWIDTWPKYPKGASPEEQKRKRLVEGILPEEPFQDGMPAVPVPEGTLRFEGICPDCGHDEFYGGPCGGMSQNVTCAHEGCGTKLNVTCLPGVSFYERI